jgi:hypothetical protein
MGYFLLGATLTLASSAIELIEQPNAYFHANGYAVLVCLLAMLAWPLIHWRRNNFI